MKALFFVRLFFAFGLMGWGQFVFAAETGVLWGYGSNTYGSGDAACQAAAREYQSIFPNSGFTFTSISLVNDATNPKQYQCKITGNIESVYPLVYRYGSTTCPDGVTYNPTIGECELPEPDKCESTDGDLIFHQHLRGKIGGPATQPPLTICENACQYSFNFKVKDVYRFVNPDPSQLDNAYGSYEYKGSGVSCTGGDTSNPGSVFDQPPSAPPIDKKPELTHEQKCEQWVTGADGVARRTCTAKDTYKDPGVMKCEDTNGFLKCAPGTPPPEFQDTKKTEETKKETNADGSTKTETTTTTEKTVCKGAKPCTSTKADEKTTSGTNPDGTPGDEEKECVGTGCKPEDKKDGLPDDEEEEETPRTATIGACDAAISCEGDAIDCAVLQEEKAQRCLAEENSDYPKYKSEIESQLTDDKYQLENETVQVPGLLQGSTRFLPSSCPPPKQVSLAGGHSVSVDFDLFCRFASGIAPVVVALALLFGALYVGRSFGGG